MRLFLGMWINVYLFTPGRTLTIGWNKDSTLTHFQWVCLWGNRRGITYRSIGDCKRTVSPQSTTMIQVHGSPILGSNFHLILLLCTSAFPKITYIREGQEGGSRNPTWEVCDSHLPLLLLGNCNHSITLSTDLNNTNYFNFFAMIVSQYSSLFQGGNGMIIWCWRKIHHITMLMCLIRLTV